MNLNINGNANAAKIHISMRKLSFYRPQEWGICYVKIGSFSA